MTRLQIVQKFYPHVTTIIDAKKPVQVEVTNSDVKKGSKLDHNECALAQACKRSFKADGMIIAIKTAYVIKGKKAVRFTVGDSISREITSFDRNSGFEPGIYNLERSYNDADQRRNRKNRGDRGSGEPQLKNHRVPHRTTNIRASLGKR